MIAIGFGHRKRMGKDAASKIMLDILRQRFPHKKIGICHWADKLKMVCYDLYKWAGVQPPGYYDQYPDKRKEIIPALGVTVVDLWIKVGTPMFRDMVHQDTWINYLMHSIGTMDIAIIADTRFPNEADKIKQSGGLVIKIHRDSVPTNNDVADCALEGYTDWDYSIVNKSLDETFTSLLNIVETHPLFAR